MSIQRVKDYFKKYNIEDRIIELNESSATVADAAKALGTEEDKIAKTLSFYIDDKLILILFSGNTRVNNAKYKQEFNKKAMMIPYAEVEEKIGHAVGGVCPFGINEGIDVYLDVSLKKHEEVFPACGSSNSAIKLTIPELEKYSNFKKWIDVGQ